MCNAVINTNCIYNPAFIDLLDSIRKEDDTCDQRIEQFNAYFGSHHDADQQSCGSEHVSGKVSSHVLLIGKILMAFPAFACTPRPSDGFFPLHIAALIGDVSLGCVIVSAFPAAVSVQNVKGKTPLHMAAREGHADFVELLLRINPSSAQIATKKLKLPLHFAAAEGHTGIVRQLLEVFPDGAAQRSTKGKLPLHLASRWGSTETVDTLLSAYPQGPKLLDWEYSPPLNQAIREGQEDIAIHLIQQCPSSLEVRNISGEIPLDIALRTSSCYLVAEMIKASPQSCRHSLQNIQPDVDVDKWDWSKIDLCLQGVSGLFDKEKPIYTNCEEDSIAQRTKPYLPLHIALEFSSNVTLLRRVIRMCPDLVQKQDTFGRLPFHIAAAHCKGSAIVIAEELLQLYPEAVNKRDVFGRLPLHIVLSTKPPVSFVKSLLSINPKSSVEKCQTNDRFKDDPPLFMAIDYGCSIDIIHTLALSDPNVFPSE